MTYSVHEIYPSLQGEGMNTGRPAVFCRFAGCNLWSGHERDRATAACRFCDTEFVGVDGPGGGKFRSASALTEAIANTWPQDSADQHFVVLTGGEPLLQVDAPFVEALHGAGFEIALETNGTLEPPPGLDWVCVSPKARAPLRLRAGDELKLVYPQDGIDPASLCSLDFEHFLLQPMDGPDLKQNTAAAVAYCDAHPPWRLSLQTHKLIGMR
jgi:7-carboxy-7-deazaguanine synthase (Cx14CxxC type)